MKNVNLIVQQATRIVNLVKSGRYTDAIDLYDQLRRSQDIEKMEQGDLQTLLIDLEFLVHEHPCTSLTDLEAQIRAIPIN
jgi:pentatricopeptide repeat protein